MHAFHYATGSKIFDQAATMGRFSFLDTSPFVGGLWRGNFVSPPQSTNKRKHTLNE